MIMLSALISVYLLFIYCFLFLRASKILLFDLAMKMHWCVALKKIDRFLTSFIHSNELYWIRIFMYPFFFIASKNIVQFTRENVRIHPAFKENGLIVNIVHSQWCYAHFFGGDNPSPSPPPPSPVSTKFGPFGSVNKVHVFGIYLGPCTPSVPYLSICMKGQDSPTE